MGEDVSEQFRLYGDFPVVAPQPDCVFIVEVGLEPSSLAALIPLSYCCGVNRTFLFAR